MTTTLANRHDILILFDVTNGNPNGDPDAGNLPRIDPTTNRGLVSDVCLKRKVRNYVLEFGPRNAEANGHQFDVFVRQGAVLNTLIKEGEEHAKENLGEKSNKQQQAEEAMKWLCRRFYDIRTFGAVLSTGAKEDVMTGSAHGQVRGPVQFTFAQSLHPITPLEVTITRCAVTKEEDRAKERTMGNKHIVPYALYVAKAFVSPVFAERTGFSDEDLGLFFEALQHMFDHDQSAARAEMTVRGVYDFEHVGTQAEANADQNAREARLGCAHAWKLFDGVHVTLEGKPYPESFDNYDITDEWADKNDGDTIVPGVRIHRRVDPRKNVVSST